MREFEFLILESDSNIKAWAKKKHHDGTIFVGNAEALVEEIAKRTQFTDSVMARISGGWLEQCIAGSVRRLLTPVGYGDYLHGRTISHVYVDLTKSVAWADRDMSVGDKRAFFVDILSGLDRDPRLTILP